MKAQSNDRLDAFQDARKKSLGVEWNPLLFRRIFGDQLWNPHYSFKWNQYIITDSSGFSYKNSFVNSEISLERIS